VQVAGEEGGAREGFSSQYLNAVRVEYGVEVKGNQLAHDDVKIGRDFGGFCGVHVDNTSCQEGISQPPIGGQNRAGQFSTGYAHCGKLACLPLGRDLWRNPSCTQPVHKSVDNFSRENPHVHERNPEIKLEISMGVAEGPINPLLSLTQPRQEPPHR
jgi:hypothetical protein